MCFQESFGYHFHFQFISFPLSLTVLDQSKFMYTQFDIPAVRTKPDFSSMVQLNIGSDVPVMNRVRIINLKIVEPVKTTQNDLFLTNPLSF